MLCDLLGGLVAWGGRAICCRLAWGILRAGMGAA